MKNHKTLLALASLLAVTFCTGCSNIRTLGRVNGVELTRVTTRGVFSPCTTTILAHPVAPHLAVPGQVEVLVSATGPGFIPACATAGGIAGGAALLRPARTTINNSSENYSGGSSQHVPPGHINNPSQQH